MSQPNAASAKEKKTSDKDLDLSNCNRGVWLVKVPKYIADRWESVEPNATVGKVKLAKRPGEKPLITLSLDDKIVAERNDTINAKNGASNGSVKSVTSGISRISTTQQKIPKDHKFVVSTISSQHMAVFSHTAGTSAGPTSPLPPCPDKLSLEGVVAQRAECRPVSNTDQMYMKLKKESLLKPVTMSRKTVHLSQVVNSYKPIARHAANIKYEEKKKAEGKKSRDDKDKVQDILFALFEKHQYYNIKDLVRETRQPVTYLKSILNEVCNYNVKNPHKNMWELKPEYRHYQKNSDDEAKKKDGDASSDDD
jgi:transcription initiation factor TFIIF subunit beta